MTENETTHPELTTPAAFYFKLKWDDMEADFREVSGLPVKFVGETNHLKEGIGATYDNVVLKRGFFVGGDLKWMGSLDLLTNIKVSDILISLVDETNTVISAWKLLKGYPVAIKVADFKTDLNTVAVETIEFAFNQIKYV